MKRGLHEPALAQPGVALGEQQPVAEHRAEQAHAGALDEVAIPGHQQLFDGVGMEDHEDADRAPSASGRNRRTAARTRRRSRADRAGSRRRCRRRSLPGVLGGAPHRAKSRSTRPGRPQPAMTPRSSTVRTPLTHTPCSPTAGVSRREAPVGRSLTRRLSPRATVRGIEEDQVGPRAGRQAAALRGCDRPTPRRWSRASPPPPA